MKNESFTEITEEMQKELERSYFVLNGVCWQAFESENGVWLIRIVDIHDLEKCMWLKVRFWKKRRIKAKDICFDFIDTNMTEVLKYKYLYDTERNHDLLASVFLGKYSVKKSERRFYEENIHRIEELKRGDVLSIKES